LVQFGITVFYKYSIPTFAASYTFTQTDWSGSASTTATGLHPGDATGWDYFDSASSTITAGTELTLTAQSASASETSDGDFGAGTTATTTVASGSVGLESSSIYFNPMVQKNNYNGYILRTDGTVWGWGANGYGSVGDGTNTQQLTPVQVVGEGGLGTLTDITDISAGVLYFVLALKSDGTVWGWGRNSDGQLAHSTIDSNTPLQALASAGTPFTGVSKIASGHRHSNAVKTDGTVWSWGYGYYGQMGNGTKTYTNPYPVQVKGVGGSGYLLGAIDVAAGCQSGYALKSDGTVWSWGYGGLGQLGNGGTTEQLYPVQVVGEGGVGNLMGIIDIVAGCNQAYALDENGNVWAWGRDTTDYGSIPVQLALSNVTQIAAGSDFGLALLQDGTVRAWGTSIYLAGTTISSNVISIAGGGGTAHAILLRSNGTVYSWGEGSAGQTGDGSTSDRTTLTQVKGVGGSGYFDAILDATYYSTGTFTSDIIDLGTHAGMTTLDYTTTLNSQTITMDIRAGDTASPDGTWTAWTTSVASGGDISALGSNRYVQYRANLSTNNTAVTPTLDDVTINYNNYTEGTLISNPYDASDATNVIGGVSWTENAPSGTSVSFQLRTSADGASWTEWTGPSGAGTYFTDSSGAQNPPAGFTDAENDQWIQYLVRLNTDGSDTPTLSDVTLTYVVNAPPDISITTSTVAMSSSGTIILPYQVRDTDNNVGATPGEVSISLQYCTASCSSSGSEVWATAATSTLTGDFDAGISIDQNTMTNYTEYSLVWDAKSSYNNQYNGTDFKVRLVANDSEAANNLGYGESNVFVFDTTDPVVSVTTDGRSDAGATLTFAVTEDTLAGLEMKISNSSDLSADGTNASSGTWIAYATTTSWTLASVTANTVYYQMRDVFGNTSVAGSISSAVTPEVPRNIVYQDISNSETSEWRFFLAWEAINEPAAGFKQYNLYRSTDGESYSLLSTETDKAINYIIDTTVSAGTTYYYKVTAEDNNDNISQYSTVVSDAPDGQGGSDTAGPIISSVTSTSITPVSAEITWDTAELSSSYVDYLTVTSSDFADAPSVGVTTMKDTASSVGQHSVILTGLTPNTTYYYQVRSIDPLGNATTSTESPGGYSFTTLSGPTLSNVSVSTILNTQATITWDSDEAADSYVYYSTDSSFDAPTQAGQAESITSHSVTLTGLSPSTTYFFYVASGVGVEKQVIAGIATYYSLMTTADLTAPVITFDADTDVGLAETNITLAWTTDEAASSTVEYGTSNAYGSTLTNDNFNTNHSFNPTSLLRGTLYYFSIQSADINGNISSATQFSATTTDETDYDAPIITSVTSSVVTDSRGLITWLTDENATGQIYYGTSSTTLTSSSTLVSTYNQAHSIVLSGLTSSTLYYYYVESSDATGNTATSSVASFTTLEALSEESDVLLREQAAEQSGITEGQSQSSGGGGGGIIIVNANASDLIAPLISNVTVSDITGVSATITWDSDETSDSVVEFGKDRTYGRAGINTADTTNHRITLIELSPLTTYYYRISSEDAANNKSLYTTGSFTTTLSGLVPRGDDAMSALIDPISGQTAEEIFLTSLERASNIIKTMSTQVSIGVLESTLVEQNNVIRELSKILPAPIISGQPGLDIHATDVTVSWKTDKDSNSLVNIAPDTLFTAPDGYQQTTGKPDDSTTDHIVTIHGLRPNTLYHYRLISQTNTGIETTSRDFTFKTPIEVSEITTYKVENTTDNGATFAWITSAPTDSVITYTPYKNGSPLAAAQQVVRNALYTTQHTLDIAGLESGLVYDIEMSGQDYNGTLVSKTIQGFSTDGQDRPPIIAQIQTDTSILPGNADKVQVIVSWTTNELATSQVFYRKGFAKDGSSFSESSTLDPTFAKKHIAVITDFEPGQIYQFAVGSTDTAGNESISKTMTILTPRKQESVFQVIMGNFESIFSWVGKMKR
ncbi:MAG: hypothetical protein CO030_00985, partial [Candidatus Magasanikbacteria bacterium CG_4_9_14_0_2_um_filter_42_11]